MWRMLCERGTDLEIATATSTPRATTRLGSLGRRLHVHEHGPQGPQRDRRELPVPRRADRRPRRQLQPLAWTRQAFGPGRGSARLVGPISEQGSRGRAGRGSTTTWRGGRPTDVSERLSASDMSSLLAERGPDPRPRRRDDDLRGQAAPNTSELLEHVELAAGARAPLSPADHPDPLQPRQPGLDRRRPLRPPLARAPRGAAEARRRRASCASSSAGSCPSRSTSPGRCGSSTWSRGSSGGRFAVVPKTHHALVDGVAAVDVGTVVLDPNRDGTEMEIPSEPWDPDEPSPEMLFVRAASRADHQPAAGCAQRRPRGDLDAALDRGPGDADGRGVRGPRLERPDRAADVPQPARSAATAGSPTSRASSTC